MTAEKHSEYVCARCAAQGQTCCGLGKVFAASATDSECFPVSPAERQRIEQTMALLPETGGKAASWAGADFSQLFHAHDNTPEFIDALLGLFPGRRGDLERLYPAGGQHLRMRLTAAGNCLLLGERGCILPPDVRPRFCRIFPFWVRRGSLRCFAPEGCLAVREGAGMRQILKAFSLEQADVLRLFESLKRDWGLGD